MSLLVAPCSYEAAKHACLNWHYQKKMPRSKLLRLGVWEQGRFIGVIVFGVGVSTDLGTPYGLDATEVTELVRVALRDHTEPVSQAVAVALRCLKERNPRLRLVVSFADPVAGHHGGIYQAGNWIYAGTTPGDNPIRIKGKAYHSRTVIHWYGTKRIDWLRAHVDPDAMWLRGVPKHRYLYPLDRAMRRRILSLAQPYPRGGSVEGDTSGLRPEEAGSTPAHRSTPQAVP